MTDELSRGRAIVHSPTTSAPAPGFANEPAVGSLFGFFHPSDSTRPFGPFRMLGVDAVTLRWRIRPVVWEGSSVWGSRSLLVQPMRLGKAEGEWLPEVDVFKGPGYFPNWDGAIVGPDGELVREWKQLEAPREASES